MGFETMMPLQSSVGQNRKIVTILMTQTAGLVFPISSCPCPDPMGQCGGGNSIKHPSNTRRASPCPLCLSAYATCCSFGAQEFRVSSHDAMISKFQQQTLSRVGRAHNSAPLSPSLTHHQVHMYVRSCLKNTRPGHTF
jgi:hypothetical protein